MTVAFSTGQADMILRQTTRYYRSSPRPERIINASRTVIDGFGFVRRSSCCPFNRDALDSRGATPYDYPIALAAAKRGSYFRVIPSSHGPVMAV